MEQQMIPATFGRAPLTYDDLEGKSLGDFTSPADLADLDQLAGVWPVRWLFAPEIGDRPRAIHLFAGCGGWCVGLRYILGVDLDMVCVDSHKDAVATSRASGCTAICADVTTLDPEHPALRWTQYLIASPPCIEWTVAGTRSGHMVDNMAILTEVIHRIAWAAGNYAWGETFEDDEDHPDYDPETDFVPEYGPPSGETWEQVRALAAEVTTSRKGKKPTAHLMVEPILWALALWKVGAPLHTVAVEQAAALPESLREDFESELYGAGWESVQWVELDAADYGSPSHRRRALMLAHRYYNRQIDPEHAIDRKTFASDALGMDPDTVIITRANRTTSGGNGFRLGRVVPGITSKIRAWYKQDDETFRFTIAEIARLVTMPADHPVTGSRSSITQQLADIVAPVVSAAVLGTLLGIDWMPLLLRYLAEQYPNVHGPEEPPQPEPPAPPARAPEIPRQTYRLPAPRRDDHHAQEALF